MRKIFIFLLGVVTLSAQGVPITDSTKKVQVWIDGRVDALAIYDSYKSVERSGGIQYLFPARPSYNSEGFDMNSEPSLRFGIASSRLGLGAKGKVGSNVTLSGYVQVDMMGAFTNGVGSLRLRHAYFKANIGNSALTIGQTSHLIHIDELAADMVSFGSGNPYNPLARPITFKFSQQVGRFNIAAAASMFFGDVGRMQSRSLVPDLAARVMYIAPSGSMVGIAGGFQYLAPDIDGMERNLRLSAGYAEVFGKVCLGKGYAISLAGIYGGNMQSIGLTGGIAPTINGDGYATVNAASTWIHFNTAVYSGFQFYIFGGYQKNLGTYKSIDKSRVICSDFSAGIDSFFKISPGMWYRYKMLAFGLEYSFSQSIWAHQLNNRYLGTTFYQPTTDNRVTLLARFNF